MSVYLAWSYGRLQSLVGTAMHVEDMQALRGLGSRMAAANEALLAWVRSSKGDVIANLGSGGVLAVDPEKAIGVAGLVDRLTEYFGSTMHIGLGLTAPESWKALGQAERQGIPYVLYDPEEDEESLSKTEDLEKNYNKSSVPGYPNEAHRGPAAAPSGPSAEPDHPYRAPKARTKTPKVTKPSKSHQDLMPPPPEAPEVMPKVAEGVTTDDPRFKAYDYSHLLPADMQQSGHRLVVMHHEAGDHFSRALVVDPNSNVIPGHYGWAYPSTAAQDITAPAPYLREALLQHQPFMRWRKHDLSAEGASAHPAQPQPQAPPAVGTSTPLFVPPPSGPTLKSESDIVVDPEAFEDPGFDARHFMREALQAVKAQAPVFEQLRAQSPEAYQALQRVISAMVLMGHEIAALQAKTPEEVQKAEDDLYKQLGLPKPKLTGVRKIKIPYSKPEPGPNQSAPENFDKKRKSTTIDPATGAPDKTKWHSLRSGQVVGRRGGIVPSREPNQD